jgi:hypothetical protein
MKISQKLNMIRLKPNKNYKGKFDIKNKVLQFESPRELINDADIFDLFMGLFNLIKRTTRMQVESMYQSKVDSLQREIQHLKSQQK